MSVFQGFILVIVLLTYAGVAVGEVPGLSMNRATIALVGAALLVAIGATSEAQAIASLDAATLLLLAAMMVISVKLRLSGFFDLVAWAVLPRETGHNLARFLPGLAGMRFARRPMVLLALVILTSGVLSALFLNDSICVMFTPVVIDVARRLGRSPLPYLVGLATAANVGSSATITGNPQNLVIGHSSGIPYLTFARDLSPVALVGLLICWGVVVLVYHGELSGEFPALDLPEPAVERPALLRTVLVAAGLLIAFLAGLPIVSSACIAAGVLMVSRREAGRILAIDWTLLAFFGGMFVVTGAVESSGLSGLMFKAAAPVLDGGVLPLSLVTAALSNVVSNVPAVLLLRARVAAMPNPQQAWLALAMASTLAGNLTLLGSAATLIVAELAAGHGVKIGFVEFLKCGVPITLLTLAVGIAWLTFLFP